MAEMAVKVKIEPIIYCGECRHAHMTADERFCKNCDKFRELGDVCFDKNFYCGFAERENFLKIRNRRVKK